MIILCDTSSILLLLRIAPDMFLDTQFECVTIHDVVKEIVETPKFKKKYPWRTQYRGKIQPMPATQYRTAEYDKVNKTMAMLLQSGILNTRTDRLIDLSEEDRAVAACAITHGYLITTGDANLVAFLRQEFLPEFKGNMAALDVINFWLEKQAITWDDVKHTVIAEWKSQNEIAQPRDAIKKFLLLTGRTYPGN